MSLKVFVYQSSPIFGLSQLTLTHGKPSFIELLLKSLLKIELVLRCDHLVVFIVSVGLLQNVLVNIIFSVLILGFGFFSDLLFPLKLM